jgi:hypothetical protein
VTLPEAARYYARTGFAVFPCTPNAKTPLTAHGVKDASTNGEQIREWWTEFPEANIAVACGKVSGILALDFDSKQNKPGIQTLNDLAAKYPVLDQTLTAETPSVGVHKIFTYARGLRNAVEVLPGLDIRTDGGYIVVCPSVIDGKRYRWTSRTRPTELPAELIKTLQRNKPEPAAPAWNPRRWTPNRLVAITRAKRYIDAVPGAVEGQAGDVQTFKLACRLVRGFALSDHEALSLLLGWNYRCRPPWSESELMAKITSARRNGREPIGAGLEMR